MACGICISGESIDGYVEMFSRQSVKARKDHRCIECKRAIAKGSEYQRVSYLWEGVFETHHTCLDCSEIHSAFDCSDHDESIQYGELWSNMREAFPGFTTGCLSKLETASAKEYLMERWRQWKGLE